MILYDYLGKNLFNAPYRLLPRVVFIFFAVCFLYHPLSPFQTFALPDPDDYMRLNEVLNWLGGQSWYDLSQPRMSPGENTIIHWSRLVDLPLAAIIWPLSQVFELRSAALVAAFIVPLVLFALLLKLVPAITRSLVGADRANLAAVFILFAPMVLFNFAPGRVDHHAYQILIAGFGLYSLERIVRSEDGWRFSILAAILFASGLWIGIEALPWLAVFVFCLGAIASWQGGFVLRNAAIFGLSLALGTAAILPLALKPEAFGQLDLSWFSIAYVIFTGFSAVMFLVGWLLGRLTGSRPMRMALMANLGALAILLSLYCVPAILQGPFANYDHFNANIALDNINEAKPLWRTFQIDLNNSLALPRAIITFIQLLFLPLLALFAAFRAFRQSDDAKRMLWLAHAFFLLTALLLTLFWQVRVITFLQLFALAPLTWLMWRWWDHISLNFMGRTRFWAEIGAFLILAPLPALLLPAAFGAIKFYPDMVMFPAARAENVCSTKRAAEHLWSAWGYIDRTYTVLTGMNEGPEILFRTPHNVIAGNYNVAGNQDVFDFFSSHDEAKAKDILKKWNVDLVLTCRHIAPFMAGLDKLQFGKNAFLQAGQDGKLHIVSNSDNPTLIEKLVNEKPPEWLKQVEVPGSKDYLLFKVQLEPKKDKTEGKPKK